MPETFLVLLCGGVMLAAALSDPKQVTPNWLRLAGIIALCMYGLGIYFYVTRDPVPPVPPFYVRIQVGLLAATATAVLCQLGFAQVLWGATQRAFAAAAFVLAVLAASNLLHHAMIGRGTA